MYNRSSAVDVRGLVSRGRQANPVLTYETALRRFFASRRWHKPMMRAVFPALRRWRIAIAMAFFMERTVWRKQKQRRAMHAAVCNIDVKKLVFEVDNKVELVELLLVERSRSVEHNVATAVVFRERDAVAD